MRFAVAFGLFGSTLANGIVMAIMSWTVANPHIIEQWWSGEEWNGLISEPPTFALREPCHSPPYGQSTIVSGLHVLDEIEASLATYQVVGMCLGIDEQGLVDTIIYYGQPLQRDRLVVIGDRVRSEIRYLPATRRGEPVRSRHFVLLDRRDYLDDYPYEIL